MHQEINDNAAPLTHILLPFYRHVQPYYSTRRWCVSVLFTAFFAAPKSREKKSKNAASKVGLKEKMFSDEGENDQWYFRRGNIEHSLQASVQHIGKIESI